MDWSQFEKGVFLVNILGIIYNPKTRKILIGKRVSDPYVKELGWCFPGGRPAYKNNLEFYLQKEIKKKTGLNVNVKEIILARTPSENREFLLLYYHCEYKGGVEKPGDKLTELKWVKPSEVQKYFTTSLDPKLLSYLKKLD